MSFWEKIKRKGFNKWVESQTRNAQELYGFTIGSDKNPTWNNEADAFKHAYMSWVLAIIFGDDEAKRLGDMHEDETPNAPLYERNMDLWNNVIGREIAYEIKYKLGNDWNLLGDEWINEQAKRIIWEKMQKGELITNPYMDKRKFENMELERLKDSDKVDSVIDFINFDKETRRLRSKSYIEQVVNSNWEIPSEENLNKRVDSGELIYVNNYVTSDGRKLDGYYKRRPYYSWLENKQKEEKVIKGRISNKTYIWRAEPNACGVCAELDGTEYDNEWEIPKKPHPNCRCTIEEVYVR